MVKKKKSTQGSLLPQAAQNRNMIEANGNLAEIAIPREPGHELLTHYPKV